MEKAAFGGTMRNVLSWILVLTLTLSPLMAQEAQTPRLKINNTAGHFDNTPLGNSILMYVQPFLVTQGDVSAVGTVTLTLTNAQGVSDAVTAQ